MKTNPWFYLVIYNHCPFAVYSSALLCLAALRVLSLEHYDLSLFCVVRYRLEKGSSIDAYRKDVTDSFLKSLSNYGVSERI